MPKTNTEQNIRPLVPMESFSILADGLDHPEGLAFDRDGNLWAGGELGQIYRISPGGNVETVAELGGSTLASRCLARAQYSHAISSWAHFWK